MRKEKVIKGWVFVYEDEYNVLPTYEEGCYTDFNKAFERLIELNHDAIVNAEEDFYEKGYGNDGYGAAWYPKDDKELAEANENADDEEFYRLLNKHILKDERQINKLFVNCEDWYYDIYGIEMYALKEIDIIMYD